MRKRRYGRLQKAMGDFSLLAGSPADAADHYNTASELSRICNDSVWCAAALIGMANAKVRRCCTRAEAGRIQLFNSTTCHSPHLLSFT